MPSDLASQLLFLCLPAWLVAVRSGRGVTLGRALLLPLAFLAAGQSLWLSLGPIRESEVGMAAGLALSAASWGLAAVCRRTRSKELAGWIWAPLVGVVAVLGGDGFLRLDRWLHSHPGGAGPGLLGAVCPVFALGALGAVILLPPSDEAGGKGVYVADSMLAASFLPIWAWAGFMALNECAYGLHCDEPSATVLWLAAYPFLWLLALCPQARHFRWRGLGSCRALRPVSAAAAFALAALVSMLWTYAYQATEVDSGRGLVLKPYWIVRPPKAAPASVRSQARVAPSIARTRLCLTDRQFGARGFSTAFPSRFSGAFLRASRGDAAKAAGKSGAKAPRSKLPIRRTQPRRGHRVL